MQECQEISTQHLMESPVINFSKEDVLKDNKMERAIRFWIEIKNRFSDSPYLLRRKLAEFAQLRIRAIDTEYFKPRIIAVCPTMNITRISSPPEPDKHYHIFVLLKRNARRINQDLPNAILALLE